MTNITKIFKLGLMFYCIKGFGMTTGVGEKSLPKSAQPIPATARTFCQRWHHFLFIDNKVCNLHFIFLLSGPIYAIYYITNRSDAHWVVFFYLFFELMTLFFIIDLFIIAPIRVCCNLRKR